MTDNTQGYEINDPYVGKVYGNRLDLYDNPSYNIKLYLVKYDISNRLTQENIFDSEELIDPNTGEPVKRSDIVVVAQTGVTGTQIDNVEIDAVVTPDAIRQNRVRFDIIQPGAANFLDQLLLARDFLGHPTSNPAVTMFLEIRFQGYEGDKINDTGSIEEGGKLAVIDGPLRYKIILTNFSISVDQSGSQYNCEAVHINEYAYRGPMFTMPSDFHTVGDTVKEHVESLQEQLNEWHRDNENTPQYEVKDAIEFDLDGLFGVGQGGISSTDFLQSPGNLIPKRQREEATRLMNGLWDAKDLNQLIQERIDNQKTTGTEPEPIYTKDRLFVKKGTTFERYFSNLFSMTEEFYSKITRKEDIEDINSKIDKEKAYISWFRINTEVKEIDYDAGRNGMAYKYIYKPELYKNCRTDVAQSAEENNLNKEERKARLEQIKVNALLFKSYNYIFTGLNDQILNLDITYDSGMALAVPPAAGTRGSYSTSQSLLMASNLPSNIDPEDSGAEGLLEKVTLGQAIDNILNVFDELRDQSSDLRETVVSEISNFTGRTPTEVANILSDQTSNDALAFLEELDEQAVRQLAAGGNINAENTTPTESQEVTVGPDGENIYSPEFSGYNYSADFIDFDLDNEQLEEINVADLIARGYVPRDLGKAIEVTNSVEATQAPDNPVQEAGFKIASAQNTLFGVLANQLAREAFLNRLEMTVRGDPWYLGAQSSFRVSDSNRGSFKKDDNLFWLRISAPRIYDPDWSDEDSPLNSGYWNFKADSYTFSGIYRMHSVVNKFSGGIYTCELGATRITGIDEPYYYNQEEESTEESESNNGDDQQASENNGIDREIEREIENLLAIIPGSTRESIINQYFPGYES